MHRRTFMKLASGLVISSGGALGVGVVAAQQLVPVRLLVLRRVALSPTNHCKAPCIRGRLFDVSGMTSGPLDETLIPLVAKAPPLCDVIERPWKNNTPFVSSIPRGQYSARIEDKATKKWMDNENKRWRLELEGTNPRSAIQFHYGEDVSWSEGCFIVGALRQSAESAGISSSYCQLDGAENAIASIRQAVTALGRNAKDIKIGVANHNGLFPDFTATSPC